LIITYPNKRERERERETGFFQWAHPRQVTCWQASWPLW